MWAHEHFFPPFLLYVVAGGGCRLAGPPPRGALLPIRNAIPRGPFQKTNNDDLDRSRAQTSLSLSFYPGSVSLYLRQEVGV